jgi:hypothetical protein
MKKLHIVILFKVACMFLLLQTGQYLMMEAYKRGRVDDDADGDSLID